MSGRVFLPGSSAFQEEPQYVRSPRLFQEPYYASFQKLEFLGHMVGRGRLQPREKKVQKILSIAKPTTKRQVRVLLGLVGYYRRYVPNLASLTAPISDLLSGKPRRQIVWSQAFAEALRKIRNIISAFPVLLLLDLSLSFVVRTVPAVWELRCRRGKLICFVSRKILERKKRYSTIERECFAIVSVLCKLQRYLWGRSFLIQTDHRPLTYLRSEKFQNARIMRWALTLQEFTFEVESIPGTRTCLQISYHVLSVVRKFGLSCGFVDTDSVVQVQRNSVVSSSSFFQVGGTVTKRIRHINVTCIWACVLTVESTGRQTHRYGVHCWTGKV